MLEVERGVDLEKFVDWELEPGDWISVTQEMVDTFAKATGDHQWIHVDTERARAEMPDGKTIAHGYLTLSLLPGMAATVFRVRQKSRGVNYGSNKVRFTTPVQTGSRIRLHQTVKKVERIEGGVRATMENRVEIENVARPALIAETVQLIFD